MKREELMVKLDFTKPVVVRADTGVMQQAEGTTLEAAKDLAKKIAEEEGLQATVLVPHTTYKRKANPVQEIKHKLREHRSRKEP